MIATTRAKRWLAVALLSLGALVAVVGIAQAALLVVQAGTGADPADAFNRTQAVPEDLGVAVTWAPDPGDLGRALEPRTRQQVASAIAQGWAELDLAQRTGNSDGAVDWFTGRALDQVRATGRGGIEQRSHRLRAEFYSDDGTVLTLVDRAVVARSVPGGEPLELVETHRVSLLLQDGNWRIHGLERVAAAPAPTPAPTP